MGSFPFHRCNRGKCLMSTKRELNKVSWILFDNLIWMDTLDTVEKCDWATNFAKYCELLSNYLAYQFMEYALQ